MVFKGSLISDSTVKKTKISVQAKDRFTFSTISKTEKRITESIAHARNLNLLTLFEAQKEKALY